MSIDGIPADFTNANVYINGLINNPQQKSTDSSSSTCAKNPAMNPNLCAKFVPAHPLLEEKQALLQRLRERAYLRPPIKDRPIGSKVEKISKEGLKKK